jgi:hypothetical protein
MGSPSPHATKVERLKERLGMVEEKPREEEAEKKDATTETPAEWKEDERAWQRVRAAEARMMELRAENKRLKEKLRAHAALKAWKLDSLKVGRDGAASFGNVREFLEE